MNNAATKRVVVYVSEEEKDALKLIADDARTNVSTWVRMAIARELKRLVSQNENKESKETTS